MKVKNEFEDIKNMFDSYSNSSIIIRTDFLLKKFKEDRLTSDQVEYFIEKHIIKSATQYLLNIKSLDKKAVDILKMQITLFEWDDKMENFLIPYDDALKAVQDVITQISNFIESDYPHDKFMNCKTPAPQPEPIKPEGKKSAN